MPVVLKRWSVPTGEPDNTERVPSGSVGGWGKRSVSYLARSLPNLDAMGVVAEAINALLEADPQTSVREALGDLDVFREAVDCLDAYEQFRPDHFDRHEANTQLQSLAWSAEETP